MTTPDFLRRLPKIELHCHLEGSVPAATAVALANRNDVALPTNDPERLYEFGTLEAFLDIYVAVSRAMARPDDFATVVYDSLADAVRTSNLRYREFAFNPTNHPGVDLADMLSAMTDAAASAESEFGIQTRFIVAINREQPPSVALDLMRQVIDLAHPLIVGVGLDHNELVGPPAAFADAFALAADAGLHRTAHAGERGDATEVRDSIELLTLNRVDHGYAALLDPALVADSIAAGIHYAACWSTAGFHADEPAHSPIGDMIDAGLDVSISSDDPPMFGTDIGREYTLAGQELGWTIDTARAFVLNCAQATFLPQAERDELADRLATEIDAMSADVSPVPSPR
jgi:adenosine deaminase